LCHEGQRNITTLKNELWVAAGGYHEGAFPAKTIAIPDGVGLYGGFLGNEVLRDARNPSAHPTVIEGDLPNDLGNACHVVTLAGNVTLSGFVIANGDARGQIEADGGGIVVTGGAPTIDHCVFRGHRADYGAAVAVLGGTPSFSDNHYDADNRAAALGSCTYVATGASVEATGDVLNLPFSRRLVGSVGRDFSPGDLGSDSASVASRRSNRPHGLA
jgi:hypothetical protein